jgi:hypothetical protein
MKTTVKPFLVDESEFGILTITVMNEDNSAVDTKFLHDHVSHENRNVRFGVSRNKKTSPYDLRKLSKDSDPMVRFGVASNSRVHPLILDELMNDENEFVRALASYRMGVRIESDMFMAFKSRGYVYNGCVISKSRR